MNNHIKYGLGVLAAAVLIVFCYLNLEHIVDHIVYVWLKLEQGNHWTESLHFFLFDTSKILILLFVISSFMGVINTYFPVERIRSFLNSNKLYGLEYLIASLFGAVTPFCSCSSIPLFIGFVNGGIPLGVTFAFLITSPLVNEVAIAMFLGSFGVKVTMIYAISGILLGAFGGAFLGQLKLENGLSDWVKQIQTTKQHNVGVYEGEKRTFIDRIPSIISESWAIVRGVLLYIFIGIAIGALIHGFVPEDFFTEYLSTDKWYAVPLAVLLAVPMYANATAVVPIIQVFVAKGVPLGTAIAFMMAVVGLSLPEATLLKKVMKWKLIVIFFGFITISIIVLGYFFNSVL